MTAIDKTAQRKRALHARFYSWGRRHLLGEAGEEALAGALLESQTLTNVTGSTRTVLGVDTGEIDNSAVYVEVGEAMVPVQVLFEVKNTREHYYANDDDVLTFLRKAAEVQAARPQVLVLPIFVCRRWQYTLWEQGEAHGFLPAMVMTQLVKKDPDLGTDEWMQRFGEVKKELLPDIVAVPPGSPWTTNRHRGIVTSLIPKRGVEYAQRWRESHTLYLPG